MRLVALIVGNILGIFIASRYIEGVTLEGGLSALIIVGLAFSIINFFLKPILKLVLSPFILLTFGLLIIGINMAILKATDILFPQFHIAGIGALFLTTLLVSVINILIHLLARK